MGLLRVSGETRRASVGVSASAPGASPAARKQSAFLIFTKPRAPPHHHDTALSYLFPRHPSTTKYAHVGPHIFHEYLPDPNQFENPTHKIKCPPARATPPRPPTKIPVSASRSDFPPPSRLCSVHSFSRAAGSQSPQDHGQPSGQRRASSELQRPECRPVGHLQERYRLRELPYRPVRPIHPGPTVSTTTQASRTVPLTTVNLHSASDIAARQNKKTIQPKDVLDALKELEFDMFIDRTNNELNSTSPLLLYTPPSALETADQLILPSQQNTKKSNAPNATPTAAASRTKSAPPKRRPRRPTATTPTPAPALPSALPPPLLVLVPPAQPLLRRPRSRRPTAVALATRTSTRTASRRRRRRAWTRAGTTT